MVRGTCLQYSHLDQLFDIVDNKAKLTLFLLQIDAGSTELCGPSKDLIWSFYWYSFFLLEFCHLNLYFKVTVNYQWSNKTAANKPVKSAPKCVLFPKVIENGAFCLIVQIMEDNKLNDK